MLPVSASRVARITGVNLRTCLASCLLSDEVDEIITIGAESNETESWIPVQGNVEFP
jgi:hypothetical protein